MARALAQRTDIDGTARVPDLLQPIDQSGVAGQMVEFEFIEREVLRDRAVLSQNPRAAHDKGVGVFFAQDRDLDGVVAVRDRIDDSFVDRDWRIFGFIGEPAIGIAPLECLEEGQLGHEGAKAARRLLRRRKPPSRKGSRRQRGPRADKIFETELTRLARANERRRPRRPGRRGPYDGAGVGKRGAPHGAATAQCLEYAGAVRRAKDNGFIADPRIVFLRRIAEVEPRNQGVVFLAAQ